ncbi:MAG: aminotransferase class V-fold PLP-dependent enzyme [bacterium]|nr:aminotransferase class V-fold PLP-dependent enzyme [bacterium]
MTLDLSPDEFRRLGYQAIDALADLLANVHDAPARRPLPENVRQHLHHQPLPEEGADPAALLERVFSEILPYPMGNSSPRFFAWVNSPPAPLGVLAELLAAAHNASLAGGDHAATYVEHAVLNWFKAIVGFPDSSGGLLTSGGSMANIVALAVMRHVKAQGDVRKQGLQNEGRRMVIYTSEQGHSCIQKAVELLGLGSAYLRHIPTDDEFRMDITALRVQIKADKLIGLRPVCIAASAGTVNTGAIDSLDEIAEICRNEGMWFHVDGAYGAVGVLSDQAGHLYAGLEKADSIALDPHKWLYVPIECGCTLVKDPEAMRATFSVTPPYLRDDRALPWFSEFGPQQTRAFKALKVWLTMQQIGLEGYRDLISRDIELAGYLQSRIHEREDFGLVAAGPLSITCFRYAPPGVAESALDDLNRAVLNRVQQEGKVYLTGTMLDGKQALRACIVNFRTSEADLDFLLDTLAEAGAAVQGKQA